MDAQKYRQQIEAAKTLVADAISKTPPLPEGANEHMKATAQAVAAENARVAAFIVIGLELFGELFLDIKRSADALERIAEAVAVERSQ